MSTSTGFGSEIGSLIVRFIFLVFRLEMFDGVQLFLENIFYGTRNAESRSPQSQALFSDPKQIECRLIVDSNSFLLADSCISHRELHVSPLEPRLDLEFSSVYDLIPRRELPALVQLRYCRLPKFKKEIHSSLDSIREKTTNVQSRSV